MISLTYVFRIEKYEESNNLSRQLPTMENDKRLEKTVAIIFIIFKNIIIKMKRDISTGFRLSRRTGAVIYK